jgi:hypothetical protein
VCWPGWFNCFDWLYWPGWFHWLDWFYWRLITLHVNKFFYRSCLSLTHKHWAPVRHGEWILYCGA